MVCPTNTHMYNAVPLVWGLLGFASLTSSSHVPVLDWSKCSQLPILHLFQFPWLSAVKEVASRMCHNLSHQNLNVYMHAFVCMCVCVCVCAPSQFVIRLFQNCLQNISRCCWPSTFQQVITKHIPIWKSRKWKWNGNWKPKTEMEMQPLSCCSHSNVVGFRS